MPVAVDESRHPLIIVRFEPPIGDADVTAFGAAMDALLKREQLHALCFDTGGLTALSAGQRAQMVALSKATEAQSKRFVVCSCVALTSALGRGVITAINWFAPPPFEQRFFKTLDECVAHAAQRLKERGLAVEAA